MNNLKKALQLRKARQHKYLRRERKGNRWVYFYKEGAEFKEKKSFNEQSLADRKKAWKKRWEKMSKRILTEHKPKGFRTVSGTYIHFMDVMDKVKDLEAKGNDVKVKREYYEYEDGKVIDGKKGAYDYTIYYGKKE